MKVSIVIPVYNNFPLLNDLLAGLRDNTDADEILIADDISPDRQTQAGIRWWEDNYENVKSIRHPSQKNIGFLRNSNFGMRIASGNIICLISTDVIIGTDLCSILKRAIEENPKRLIGGTVYHASTGWNQFGAKVFPYAEGWLLAATRENWEELGYFDERYSPNDFEDVDLSTTALQKGFELHSLNHPRIRHIGGQSIGYNEQREELTKRNQKTFEAKWITKSSGTV